MDFSAFNPASSNALSLAARENNVIELKKQLKAKNVNLCDNRGWTCLHEAAAHDNIECVKLILKQRRLVPLHETHEGHTALYLAIRERASLELIKMLLDKVRNIIKYSSLEMVSPLHLACKQGRIDVIEMLLRYGARIDAQDFDGDTPLHDAIAEKRADVASLLLHAGAQAEILNNTLMTPLHMACIKESVESVKELFPFLTDINSQMKDGKTPLMIATNVGCVEIVRFLLEKKADPNMRCNRKSIALDYALKRGKAEVFNMLLEVTDRSEVGIDIFSKVCRPHYFSLEVFRAVLESNLGEEYYCSLVELQGCVSNCHRSMPSYFHNSPLNLFLDVADYIYKKSKDLLIEFLYMVLSKGISANIVMESECPPIVYMHHGCCEESFYEVFRILIEHDVDVNKTYTYVPAAFIASMVSGGRTITTMLPYAIVFEPLDLFRYAKERDFIMVIQKQYHHEILSLIYMSNDMTYDDVPYTPLPLKHLTRVTIRGMIRKSGVNTYRGFMKALEGVPAVLRPYLRYMSNPK